MQFYSLTSQTKVVVTAVLVWGAEGGGEGGGAANISDHIRHVGRECSQGGFHLSHTCICSFAHVLPV